MDYLGDTWRKPCFLGNFWRKDEGLCRIKTRRNNGDICALEGETGNGAQYIWNHHAPYEMSQHTTGIPPQSAVSRIPMAVDQRVLKLSPDGAPETGREATQAYQISRGQFSRFQLYLKSNVMPSAFPKTRSRHFAMPTAAVLVSLLSKFFS